jgi:hypothetical protein
LIFTNPIIKAEEAIIQTQNLSQFVQEVLGGQFSLSSQGSYLEFLSTFVFPDGVVSFSLESFETFSENSQPVGLPFATSSRLIPVTSFATPESRTLLLDNLLGLIVNGTLAAFFANTPYYYGLDHTDRYTSVTPAWRESLWHVRM